MLNGIDPILIFQLYKLVPASEQTLANIPLTAGTRQKATFAIIPIYLSELITGVYIDTESKSIDIDTELNSLTLGDPVIPNQKALGSITTVNLVAKRGSVGLTILLAISELLLDKVTSQEYELTYINGAVTVFGGLIHGFSFEQGTNDDLYKIRLELSRGRPKSKSVQVQQDPNAARLGSAGSTPAPEAPTTSGGTNTGTSQISPSIGVRLN